MINELSDCLKSNSSIFDVDYTNLGKNLGSSLWNRRKILLSYSDSIGWNVVKLNAMQLFFRKVLGAYRSTHLNHVTKKLKKSKISDEMKSCHVRIWDAWARKNILVLGNTTHPRVICFAEKHGDESFRTYIAQFINAHYEQGDVILVEGACAGEVVNHHQTVRNIKAGCIVRGWEPEAALAVRKKIIEKATEKTNAIKNHLLSLRNFLSPLKSKLSLQEIESVQLRLNESLSFIRQINEYYHCRSELVLQSEQIISEAFKKFKHNDSVENQERGLSLFIEIGNIFVEIEKKSEKLLYINSNSTVNDDLFNQRNESLVKEISNEELKDRKIFVVAGASHLLEFPAPFKSCKGVQDALKKDEFIVLVRKKHFTLGPYLLNSDLNTLNLLPSL